MARGDSYTATVYLTVYSIPMAKDDYYTDAENQTLTVLGLHAVCLRLDRYHADA